jgi:hypothetical protein
MRIRTPNERRLSPAEDAALHTRISDCPFCGGWSQLMTSEDINEDARWWGGATCGKEYTDAPAMAAVGEG